MGGTEEVVAAVLFLDLGHAGRRQHGPALRGREAQPPQFGLGQVGVDARHRVARFVAQMSEIAEKRLNSMPMWSMLRRSCPTPTQLPPLRP